MFSLGTERHEFAMGSETRLSLDDDDETLKEEAAAIIRTFHKQNPNVKQVIPSEIQMDRDGICLLTWIRRTHVKIVI